MSHRKNYNHLHLSSSRGFFIPQDCSLLDIARIIQEHTDYTISVMNDQVLHFFSPHKSPENLELLSYNADQTEYCFSDAKGNYHVIFTKQKAQKFMAPKIQSERQITLVDKDKSFLFSYLPSELIIKTYQG